MAAGLACLLAVGAPAHAQEGPYGSTTTTTGGPSAEASCDLSVTSGAPGTPVTATVQHVPASGTVRILFGGGEVGRGTAAADEDQATLQIDFAVPAVDPGRYLVTAVGADFTVTCSSEVGGFGVLAAGATAGGGGGSLPKTGVYVGALLVLAAVLLVVGRALLDASRQRRQLAARSHLRR